MAKADSNKADTLKPRLPRGFVDRRAAEIAAPAPDAGDDPRRASSSTASRRWRRPFVEYTEALGKFLPDLDRPNEGVFSFQDDDESWLSLRYDLTAPLARHVAEHFDAHARSPIAASAPAACSATRSRARAASASSCSSTPTPSAPARVAADAEICMMMADTLERLGHPRGAVRGQGQQPEGARRRDGGDRARRRRQGRAAADRAARHRQARPARRRRRAPAAGRRPQGRERRLHQGRGARRRPRSARPDASPAGPAPTPTPASDRRCRRWRSTRRRCGQRIGMEGVHELAEIAALFDAAGYGDDRIRIDPSVVRGLEYYTGPVFEAELTFPVTNEDGQTVRFGSVAGRRALRRARRALPGRARAGDRLLHRRLAPVLGAAAREEPARSTGTAKPGPVVVLVMDRDDIADYQRLVARLRAAGIRAELYLGGSGMKAQMKYADRRRAPCVDHPGLERARGRRGPDQGPDRGRQGGRRPSPATPSGRPRGRPSSRCRRPRWSSGCARSWDAISDSRDPKVRPWRKRPPRPCGRQATEMSTWMLPRVACE